MSTNPTLYEQLHDLWKPPLRRLLIILFLVLLLVSGYLLSQGDRDLLGVMGTLVSVLGGVIAFSYKADQHRETMQAEIYQRLELASIELFQRDVDDPEMAAYIWIEGKSPPEPDSREAIRLDQYIFQHLNLFEMAARFRRLDMVPREVFGSWVIWIAALCESHNFALRWEKGPLRLNYTEDLREIIDLGLEKLNADFNPDRDVRLRTFFEAVSKRFGYCREIESWLAKASKTTVPAIVQGT